MALMVQFYANIGRNVDIDDNLVKKKKIIKMDYIYMILEESLIKDNIVYNTCIKLVTIKL